MRTIQKVQLPLDGLDVLVQEASAEGFAFLEPLADDWTSGRNRFDGPGEAFFGVYVEQELVAIGGLNRDPFLNLSDAVSLGTGRLRRIFVRAAWRNQGIGRELVAAMLAEARRSFHTVRLRAENAGAARLYETFGFEPCAGTDATHILYFDAQP